MRADTLPQPSCNIAPVQNTDVVTQDKDGRRHLTDTYWSLVPRWSTSRVLGYPIYNARVESAHVRSAFTESTKSMRTIIPASGYYEWKGRRLFYFHAPHDELLFLTGPYSWWRSSPASPWQLTVTVITCPAADKFIKVHGRVSLLALRSTVASWLSCSVDGAILLDSMREAGTVFSRCLQSHEVAPLNSDGKCLIQPLDSTEPMCLF